MCREDRRGLGLHYASRELVAQLIVQICCGEGGSRAQRLERRCRRLVHSDRQHGSSVGRHRTLPAPSAWKGEDHRHEMPGTPPRGGEWVTARARSCPFGAPATGTWLARRHLIRRFPRPYSGRPTSSAWSWSSSARQLDRSRPVRSSPPRWLPRVAPRLRRGGLAERVSIRQDPGFPTWPIIS